MRIHKNERDIVGDRFIQACAYSFIDESATRINSDCSKIEEAAKARWETLIQKQIDANPGYDISVDDVLVEVSEDWQYGTQHMFTIVCEDPAGEVKLAEIIVSLIEELEDMFFEEFLEVFELANSVIIEYYDEEEYA